MEHVDALLEQHVHNEQTRDVVEDEDLEEFLKVGWLGHLGETYPEQPYYREVARVLWVWGIRKEFPFSLHYQNLLQVVVDSSSKASTLTQQVADLILTFTSNGLDEEAARRQCCQALNVTAP